MAKQLLEVFITQESYFQHVSGVDGTGFVQGIAQDFWAICTGDCSSRNSTSHTVNRLLRKGLQHPNKRGNAEPKPKVPARQGKIVYKCFVCPKCNFLHLGLKNWRKLNTGYCFGCFSYSNAHNLCLTPIQCFILYSRYMAWERHEHINTYNTEEFGGCAYDQELWSRLLQVSNKHDYKLVSSRFEKASAMISLKSKNTVPLWREYIESTERKHPNPVHKRENTVILSSLWALQNVCWINWLDFSKYLLLLG